MKKILIILLTLFSLASCYNTYHEEILDAPEDLIQRDSMVSILVDVELAESALRQKQNFGHEISEAKEAYFVAIFKKHNVSKEQFDRSLAFYKQDLESINSIYEDVITDLSKLESEIQLEQ